MKVSIKLESGLSSSCGCNSSGYFELLLGTLMKGDPGEPGDPGSPGEPGAPGKSAYEYAVEAGYKGTEEEYSKALSLSIIHESIGETGEVKI